jgi:CO/xanthine dehydrogenase FAD-binding subunit
MQSESLKSGERPLGVASRDKFGYVRAESIPHAVALLNELGVRSRVLAGGTDLVLLMREEPGQFDRVVDITLAPDMHAIRREGDRVIIGAGATFSEIVESRLVHETAPLLVEACHSVGATQIRNMGTLGGNVANAAACADSLPALVCLDAMAHVLTAESAQEWPVSAFVVRPNRTLLPPGGLLTALSYRIPDEGSRGAFLKLGRRNAMAISRLTVATLGRLDEQGHVAEIRIVPGSATPQIRRFARTEAFLLGQAPTIALCTEAGRVGVEEMIGITGRRWSTEFKDPALAAMITRALLQVFRLTTNGSAA